MRRGCLHRFFAPHSFYNLFRLICILTHNRAIVLSWKNCKQNPNVTVTASHRASSGTQGEANSHPYPDYGDKFAEYEKAGVKEYWIIDPLRQDARFYRLHESNLYTHIQPDESGHYRSPLLPSLVLHVETLWQEPQPDFFAIGQVFRGD
jgi:hypothetical protein